MNQSVLVVDDEPKVIDVIKPFLEREGFDVYSATDGNMAIQMVDKCHPDLILLDWMLPGISGIDVCRQLRVTSSIPIIMVTARTEELDRVLGLEIGADDYIVKPFSLREMVARIRSVLRRAQDQPGSQSTYVRGPLKIDESKFKVWKDQQEIVLTPAEFQILTTLAAKPGVVYSRLQLLQAVMGDAYMNYERTVDSHISHLRKKLEDNPAEPRFIQTVHGMGYRFGDDL
ncbi:response regulator transcription factor [Alicyclobacillus fastidiosus]|uniref:Response regulator transcription factor n=1 Tax=Alicyclobacillus fastidiosus TaxID=392011 RepID=A0ABV5AHW1_9BACL|nr:response regulator transcription factor [Alicyclobacillus fastidiosus]WEH11604.1 response regulator transcription factor [Alicyclobacillus fastidiosus]